MCSAGKSGNTRLSLIDFHMALLSKVGGDETMIGLRGGMLLLGLICRECRGNSTTTHVCEKKPLEVLFALAELNFAFENVVLHSSKNIYAQLDSNCVKIKN